MAIINEHFGKELCVLLAGVECNLIIVEFPVADKPGLVRCIDHSGARYHLTFEQAKKKGTGKMYTKEEITKIAASSFCRNQKSG